MTKEEIAKFLKVSVTTVDRWRKQGLPSIKVSRKLLFNKEDVINWLREKED
jgi:excisionase family DNA binding protein